MRRLREKQTGRSAPDATINQRRLMRDLNAIGRIGIGDRGAVTRLVFSIKELRSRQVGRVEIKKRGLELDPAELQKKLELRGPNAAVVIVTKLGGKAVAILARRVTAPSSA